MLISRGLVDWNHDNGKGTAVCCMFVGPASQIISMFFIFCAGKTSLTRFLISGDNFMKMLEFLDADSRATRGPRNWMSDVARKMVGWPTADMSSNEGALGIGDMEMRSTSAT